MNHDRWPALHGLIDQLPLTGEWGQASREDFVRAFLLVLDLSVADSDEDKEGDS